jgi:hypothetical protein
MAESQDHKLANSCRICHSIAWLGGGVRALECRATLAAESSLTAATHEQSQESSGGPNFTVLKRQDEDCDDV